MSVPGFPFDDSTSTFRMVRPTASINKTLLIDLGVRGLSLGARGVRVASRYGEPATATREQAAERAVEGVRADTRDGHGEVPGRRGTSIPLQYVPGPGLRSRSMRHNNTTYLYTHTTPLSSNLFRPHTPLRSCTTTPPSHFSSPDCPPSCAPLSDRWAAKSPTSTSSPSSPW